MGKTALSLMLTNAYPNATKKESVYVTNQSLDEVIGLQQFTTEYTTIERNISIITSLSSSQNISNEDILDYAYRPVNTNAMLFDIYSSTISHKEAHRDFMSVINQLGNRFIVMDITGDPYSEEVINLMDECDVVLYVFKPTKYDATKAREYLDSLTDDERLKVKLVCNIWDDTGVTKKTIQEFIKIRQQAILWFPYHANIQRTMFEGRLCVLNRLMIEGRDQCLTLRQPIKEILSFVCDTPNVKVIPEVSKWEV